MFIDVEAFSPILTKLVDASSNTVIENVKLPGFKISLGDATGTDTDNEPLQNTNSCKPLSFDWINDETGETLATSQSAAQDTTNPYNLEVPRTPLAGDLTFTDGALSKGNLKITYSDDFAESLCPTEDVVIGL